MPGFEKHKVTHVALESTGVFWIPVWNVLERSDAKFELILINPQHLHALPGRKTDQKDCERIAELLQYGLLKGSFIPPPPIRELRDLTRCRTTCRRAEPCAEQNPPIAGDCECEAGIGGQRH